MTLFGTMLGKVSVDAVSDAGKKNSSGQKTATTFVAGVILDFEFKT